mgnify:CR=1 FL=1
MSASLSVFQMGLAAGYSMSLSDYCRRGDLAGLQLYSITHCIAMFRLRRRATDRHVNRCCRALHEACAGGHLAVAQWLHRKLALTAADARSYDSHALYMACCGGHLNVIQWLHQTYGLNIDDVRASDAFQGACAHGHLDVAQWLHATFALTANDVRTQSRAVRIERADDGRTGIILLRLGMPDPLPMDIPLQRASSGDHVAVVRWIQRTWGLPPAAQVGALMWAPRGGACAAYLRSLYELRWSPTTHPEFPLDSRRAVFVALLVRERQTRDPELLPTLPAELWLHLLSYLPAW